MNGKKPTPAEGTIISALTSIFYLLDERLPKEEPAWMRDGIIPTLQGSTRVKDADPIDDATNARYEREDAEARQSEWDDWRAKHAALRADVENARRNPETLAHLLVLIADALDRDDERDPQPKHEHSWTRHQNVTTSGHEMPPYETCTCGQARPVREPDPDTVTLRRDDAETLLRFWEIAGGNGVVRETAQRVRAALGWGGRDDA